MFALTFGSQFQYTALDHFSRQVRKHWKNALLKQSAIESAYSKERKQRRQALSEVQDLKKRVEALETCEAQLKKWEERKERIYGLCDTVGKLKKYVKRENHKIPTTNSSQRQ